MMDLDASFDSGNIEVLDASDPRDIQLAIRKDHHSEFYQWFHFRLMGARGQQVRFHITNAAGAAYAKGWAGYNVVASDDGERWFRVPTTYKDGVLIWGHTPHSDVMTYAYFAPYPLVRHRGLLAHCGASSLATVDMLGRSVDGRAIERVRVGTGPVPLWVIARQHPGESMAEWWMEGFLTRLLDPSDALARGLREVATLHVVPNMNPDGSFRGHLRTNAVGTNLNRAWHEPTAEESPEVLAVRNAMDEAGCALALDVHGDEDLPYNFIAGPEGVAGVTDEVMEQLAVFKRDYAAINPDFQVEHGYELDAPGEANLTMCTNQITHRYGTLGMTLEMPFKDTTDTPDPVHGWSPVRCRRLGADALFPLVKFLG
jgi:murein tripeptide amidase MpaA